jgi:hypothetical protein
MLIPVLAVAADPRAFVRMEWHGRAAATGTGLVKIEAFPAFEV